MKMGKLENVDTKSTKDGTIMFTLKTLKSKWDQNN